MSPLEAEKIKLSNLDQITQIFFYNSKCIGRYQNNAFGVDFGLWEVPKIDDDDDDDDDVFFSF